MNNILPLRRSFDSAGTIFAVIRCSGYSVKNTTEVGTDPAVYLVIKNVGDDEAPNVNKLGPGESYTAPNLGAPNQTYAQVIFDGTDTPFEVTCDGTIQDPPYGSVANLMEAGIL